MLEGSLSDSFTEGSLWPVDRAGLVALTDLGLSNGQIGQYFSVESDDVHMLR